MDEISVFEADRELVAKATVGKQSTQKSILGRIGTGEAFIAGERRQEINNEFALFTVGIETASTAHMCCVTCMLFVSI